MLNKLLIKMVKRFRYVKDLETFPENRIMVRVKEGTEE